MRVAERFCHSDARIVTDDALQEFRIVGETAVYEINVFVIFVVDHADRGGVVLVLDKEEGAGIHIEDLVHQMDGLLVLQIVVELVMQRNGLALLS